MKTVIFAGGVGGSKFVEGMASCIEHDDLTVIGNTGDDVVLYGLWISPDMDILTYTLADVVEKKQGWGFCNESFEVERALRTLGGEDWFTLGDKDLATHLYRTSRRNLGQRPTEIALELGRRLGVKIKIIPPTDDPIQTLVKTNQGEMNFQEFYVREQCCPEILGVRFQGAEKAKATAEVMKAIAEAKCIMFAPSNPIASIGPILSVSEIKKEIEESPAFKFCVSPLVGGVSLKGPSDRMMKTLGFSPDVFGVSDYYGSLLDGIVIDEKDNAAQPDLEKIGRKVFVAQTIMNNKEDKIMLAKEVHKWCGAQMEGED